MKVIMKMVVLWDMTKCSSADWYKRFGIQRVAGSFSSQHRDYTGSLMG
jgi:hypothetical protein